MESLYMNRDLNALLTYKLTLERKAVLATKISFLIWDRNKATTTYSSAHFFESLIIRLLSPFNAFLLPASTTDSNDKNLRTILELLKPPDESFPSKAINFGAANVHTKI